MVLKVSFFHLRFMLQFCDVFGSILTPRREPFEPQNRSKIHLGFFQKITCGNITPKTGPRGPRSLQEELRTLPRSSKRSPRGSKKDSKGAKLWLQMAPGPRSIINAGPTLIQNMNNGVGRNARSYSIRRHPKGRSVTEQDFEIFFEFFEFKRV